MATMGPLLFFPKTCVFSDLGVEKDPCCFFSDFAMGGIPAVFSDFILEKTFLKFVLNYFASGGAIA